MSPIPRAPGTASRPAERPLRRTADTRYPTYPNTARNVLRPHPSSKHTLAAFPPGKLRSPRLRSESVR